MAEIAPIWGAKQIGARRWHIRLWAPGFNTLDLQVRDTACRMVRDSGGWFHIEVDADEGDPYTFVLPNGQQVPDPAARRQQGDVHGPSLLTSPPQPEPWKGRPWEDAVIYELHLGTFTAEGTCRAAAAELPRLADLGITVIEIMPVAQFAGDRGWGYDGVLPYAPHPAYGTPGDLAALVGTAHCNGLMVLLDVVYNHFGPEGNYLHAYAPEFFDDARQTPWGAGIDYTRHPVRRFYIENALYWLEEFGFDGLRFDAIDQIRDPSEPELLVELAREVRSRWPDRHIHLTTEDNRNVTHLHERGSNGEIPLHTAEWNDDMHNAAHVLATGETEGYYEAFTDNPLWLLGRSLAEGFAYQGENGRGQPSAHLPPVAFVDFLQNHDQTGNRALGERLITLTDPDLLEALTAIHLLSPHIPLLFMGEEYGETRPFCFFAGFEGDLAKAVREGRRQEFTGFSGFDAADVPDPIARETVEMSRLDPDRRDSPEGQAILARTRALLDIRHREIVPSLAQTGGNVGHLLTAEDGVLAVDWRLGKACLQLRANLSNGPRDMPTAEGVEIHRTAAPGSPRSVVHWLKEGS